MNIIPKLSLNKHPKDDDNLSLVNALNIKVSNDNSCITNEESIKENVFIKDYLTKYYKGNNYKIVGLIPCNVELIIICINIENPNFADIIRYHEKTNTHIEDIKCAYGNNYKLKYNGGQIKGTFTYNVENSLILAIAEYKDKSYIPLKTINLGNFDDDTIYNDNNIPDSMLSIAPEIKLPSISNLEYIAGSAYKGWYHIFIRFKINSVDYTQWYNIGFPIYVDTIEQFQITRYCYNRATHLEVSDPPLTYGSIIYPNNPIDGYGAGCSDYFSNKQTLAKETFKININFDNINFTKYQIGIVCTSKSYVKAFRTSDYIINKNNSEYIFNSETVVEASVKEFIKDNYNYFNVKNIINYKNRLYISNYIENNINADIDTNIISNIKVNLHINRFKDKGIVYDQCIIRSDNNANQYDVYKWPRIPMEQYLGVNKDTKIKVTSIGLNPITIIDNADKFIISSFTKNNFELNYGNLIIGHFEKDLLGVYTIKWINIDVVQATYTIENLDNINAQIIELNVYKYALQSGRRYINTSKSFNDRKLNDTLIPGEIYNFFIHFVDKYGHSTNGYRIDNNNKFITEDDENTEIIPIKFNVDIEEHKFTSYAAIPINNNVLDLNGKLNITNIKYYNLLTDNILKNRIIDEASLIYCEQGFKTMFDSFENNKYKDVKWFQIANPEGSIFNVYINSNGDRLFRVPFLESFNKSYIFNYDNSIKETDYLHTIYNVSFNNINIPKDYIGYFISYEKFESINRVTGLLTRNDFRNQDYISFPDKDIKLKTSNNRKSNEMLFYSSVFDISDSLKLDYNLLRIEGINVYNKEDIPEYDYMQRNSGFNFMHDMNKPQIESFKHIQSYAMPNYKICIADNNADNRAGLGTCLQINDSYNLFPVYTPTKPTNNKIKLYRASLLNTTRNIYISNNKTLIRLTDVIYETTNSSTNIISKGLPGHVTYDGVIIYENAGINFNEADKKVRQFNFNEEYYKSTVHKETPHTYENDIPFLAYLQFPIYNNVYFESKSYKNDPKGIVYFVSFNKEDSTKNKFWSGTLVTPANSIDLFENRQGSSDEFTVKSYTNYRKDLVSVEEFNKTIRRSNVIQDESRVNGWRTFSTEGYKNITENKGKITNLIGIGTLLIAHTEHSMFMFDIDNTLQTKNKNIQLAQQDAFDVEYKEVLTSDLGFGGLQDDKSYAIDQFGYIFYNNDFNRFYRFDAGNLVYIDKNIIQWLNKYKPYNVRFANDKLNNRLIIKMNYTINNNKNNITLSFNYKFNEFISLHSYTFNEAVNTKNKLYFKCNDEHNNCSLHNFIIDGSSYGHYDNVISKYGEFKNYPSKINIIINNDYESIKFLDYITYKLYKYINSVNTDFTQLPVEEKKYPFSGNIIAVYNELVNTGKLNITIDTEEAKNAFAQYDKPFWELGNWNFNYFRNNIGETVSADEMSRIFGNYFIIEFTFNNEDGLRVDFETLNYNVSE